MDTIDGFDIKPPVLRPYPGAGRWSANPLAAEKVSQGRIYDCCTNL